ncbi:DegV family protein [Microaceticoccus formicicus]|uniref:DegV family protein n=1 Tax=Microaceticoccus formicicus TaxID=3118105 RepID=UPI003CD02E7E|nr:DegV family protein [Peptoniphilaceae bacterium AMB_02]
MKKVGIITDSTAYLDSEFISKHDIGIVPLSYTFEGENYCEGVTETFDEFFNRFEKSKDFPVTSQPSTGDFLKVYNEWLEKYDELLVITISSLISGTYSNAVLASEMIENSKITIVDSLNTASNLRFMIERALELLEEKSVKEVVEILEKERDNYEVFLIVDNLEYLKRGGRISSFASSIGNFLQLKPIIGLIDGKLELVEKIRGTKKAIERVIEMIPENTNRISICHISNDEVANQLIESLGIKHPDAKITIDDLGPVIGSHIGLKAFGILFSTK